MSVGGEVAYEVATEHVERAVTVREVAAADAHPTLRLDAELGPAIETRPQPQFDGDPARVSGVAQQAADAPKASRVASRFFEHEAAGDFDPVVTRPALPPFAERVECTRR